MKKTLKNKGCSFYIVEMKFENNRKMTEIIFKTKVGLLTTIFEKNTKVFANNNNPGYSLN